MIHKKLVSKAKRVGRGIGSGKGKTAGRGTKGQKARKGGSIAMGFEGGQTKLSRRLPKYNGNKPVRAKAQIVKVSQINTLSDTDNITREVLLSSGFIKDITKPIKILFDQEFNKAFMVEMDAISTKALKALEKVGGKTI
jgi:large subunit ribosomal protein L15